jgi:hypothetical protein
LLARSSGKRHQALAPDRHRTRLGGDELDVPAGHFAVKGAARARQHRGICRLERAAREHEPPALRIDQHHVRLEGEAGKERADAHPFGLCLFEHARDLLRGARQQAAGGFVDGVQTL